MATYAELLALATDGSGAPLHKKIQVAVIVACDNIRLEADTTANHVNRLKWAAESVTQPGAVAGPLMWAVLAQNRTSTMAQILAATDAQVQSAVDAAVDLLARG